MNQKKKSKQVWMMVYSMANFNFTRGLEMPFWVQGEVPHMEPGFVQVCSTFISFHTNEVAPSQLHANNIYKSKFLQFWNLKSEPQGTKGKE